jgi:alpha-ketoglutarate-dependent 2,4-dichlorophenoxyacetate dioxygenase
MTLQLRPLHKVFGAEASGIDLTQPLTDADRRAINAAMNEHAVLVFRGQPLSAQQQIAFADGVRPARHRPEARLPAQGAARGRSG